MMLLTQLPIEISVSNSFQGTAGQLCTCDVDGTTVGTYNNRGEHENETIICRDDTDFLFSCQDLDMHNKGRKNYHIVNIIYQSDLTSLNPKVKTHPP